MATLDVSTVDLSPISALSPGPKPGSSRRLAMAYGAMELTGAFVQEFAASLPAFAVYVALAYVLNRYRVSGATELASLHPAAPAALLPVMVLLAAQAASLALDAWHVASRSHDPVSVLWGLLQFYAWVRVCLVVK